MIKGFWGIKIGMTQVFNEAKVVPVTVINVAHWYVTAIKTIERDGYCAVQIAHPRQRYVEQEFSTEWLKDLKTYFQFIKEVKATAPINDLVVGQQVSFHELFAEGSLVDVVGTSKGAGFTGVMRRYGFSGGRASHGSKLGRKPGSMGGLRTRGKIFKGKKLPGHMGVERCTVQNLELVKVAKESKMVLVKGAIPGKSGSIVFVQNGVKA